MMNMFGSSAPAMFSSAAINPPHELNCHLCGIRLGQFSGGRYGYNRNVCVSDSTHCKRLFCDRLCYYCGCNTSVVRLDTSLRAYAALIEREIALVLQPQ